MPAPAPSFAMPTIAALLALIDRIVPQPADRAEARRLLLPLAVDPSMARETGSADRFTSRARPTFLYVMYALLLGAIPAGLLAAVRPGAAAAIADGMRAYLAAIPEPLYALFGTGYLGYTVAREWGKAKGTG